MIEFNYTKGAATAATTRKTSPTAIEADGWPGTANQNMQQPGTCRFNSMENSRHTMLEEGAQLQRAATLRRMASESVL